MASFMAGVAANVSAFNTVVTYRPRGAVRQARASRDDVLRALRPHRDGRRHRLGIGTALIASTYNNIMNYIQALFSIFNAPLFATFIIGMFWKRMTPWAGLWGLIAGTLAAAATVHRLQGGL